MHLVFGRCGCGMSCCFRYQYRAFGRLAMLVADLTMHLVGINLILARNYRGGL